MACDENCPFAAESIFYCCCRTSRPSPCRSEQHRKYPQSPSPRGKAAARCCLLRWTRLTCSAGSTTYQSSFCACSGAAPFESVMKARWEKKPACAIVTRTDYFRQGVFLRESDSLRIWHNKGLPSVRASSMCVLVLVTYRRKDSAEVQSKIFFLNSFDSNCLSLDIVSSIIERNGSEICISKRRTMVSWN